MVMAKSALILAGSIFLLSITASSALFGGKQNVGPFKSDTLYLEDHCILPNGVTVEVKETSDSGHDHDHDSDSGYEMVVEKIDNMIAKGIKRIGKYIEKQQEFSNKFHNFLLDSFEQPSMNIKLWRKGHKKIAKMHKKILKKLHVKEPLRCRVMLKLKSQDEDTNSKLGSVLNFLNMEAKPWQNDYRLRIITSNPNMTQYWVEGRRLLQEVIRAQQKHEDALPISVDLATDPAVDVSPAEREEMLKMIAAKQDFLMIEMETLDEEEHKANKKANKKADDDEDEETEMIVNVYETSHRYVVIQKDGEQKNPDGTQKLKSTPVEEAELEKLPANATVEIINECPKGTFDCFANGLQCIPNYLRCNGEDNCGNNFDEIFQCSSINMYYVMGIDPYRSDREIVHQSFWLAVKFLLLVTMTCLTLYLIIGLFKCCCTCRRRRGYLVDGRTPMVYFNKGATRNNSLKQPLLSMESGSEGLRPPSPPPSYFGQAPHSNGLDNKASTINEYIYVNNNYGQPQGGTTVRTEVAPPPCQPEASAPPSYQNMYPAFNNFPTAPSYGSNQQKQ